MLRLPWNMVTRSHLHWVLTAVAFAIVMAALGSPRLAVGRVVLALLVGGVITCAIGYLLIEQELRPLTARALSDVPPSRTRRLPLTIRLLFGWAVGSALPVLGILLVLVGPRDVSGNLRISVTFLCLVVLVAGGLLMWATAGSGRRAARGPARRARRGGEGDLDVTVAVNDGGEIGELQAEFNQMVSGLRERQHLEDLFGRHVGVEVARYALSQQAGLSAQIKHASVLFVDLIASTRLATELPPVEMLAMLNALFDATVRVVTDQGGWVNKFEGTGRCASSAPRPTSPTTPTGPCGRPGCCAELAGLAEDWPRLDAGIGVSSGRVVAGNVGARSATRYTVLGDPVNEAARLTDESKHTRAGARRRRHGGGGVGGRAGAVGPLRRPRPAGAGAPLRRLRPVAGG